MFLLRKVVLLLLHVLLVVCLVLLLWWQLLQGRLLQLLQVEGGELLGCRTANTHKTAVSCWRVLGSIIQPTFIKQKQHAWMP